MAEPTRARHTAADDERLVADDVHPWVDVVSARAIDAAAGGSNLNREAGPLRADPAGVYRGCQTSRPESKAPRPGRPGGAAPLRAG